MLVAANRPPEIEGPSIVKTNNEPARASFFNFESKKLTKKNDPTTSDRYRSLNASRFKPENFDDGFNRSKAGTLKAPRKTKKAMHTTDLVKQELIHLDIDHIQMGVAGEDSWGAQPLKKYRIEPKKYTYHFLMTPIKMKDDSVDIYKNLLTEDIK